MESHVVHNGVRCQQEHNLHDAVIEGDKVEEEVQITRGEDKGIEFLCLEGDSATGTCGLDLQQQHDDGEEMRHVAGEAKDVHVDGNERS